MRPWRTGIAQKLSTVGDPSTVASERRQNSANLVCGFPSHSCLIDRAGWSQRRSLPLVCPGLRECASSQDNMRQNFSVRRRHDSVLVVSRVVAQFWIVESAPRMRQAIIPALFAVATLLVGCHSPPRFQTQAKASIAVATPSFQPMLMTTFDTQTSNDGTWRIAVSETNVAVSRFPGLTGEGWPARAKDGETTVSVPWTSHTGWLVFAENDCRVWYYDGDRGLFLFTFNETWNKESWTYVGSGCGPFYGDPGTPVSAEVFARLSEQVRKRIKSHG
jgi:hypothetical protein